MIREVGAKADSVFPPKDETSYDKTLQILQDALSNGWAEAGPGSARALIGKSLNWSKDLPPEKQWEVVKLVEKIAQNLGNDLKISTPDETIDVNAHFLTSLSPFFAGMLENNWIEAEAYRFQKPVKINSKELKFLLKTPFELPEDQDLTTLLSEACLYGMEGKTYPIFERLKSLFDRGDHQKVLERIEEKLIPPEVKHKIAHLALAPISQRSIEVDDNTINRILKLLPDDLETLNLSGFSTKKIADENRYPELQRFKKLKTLICKNNPEAYGIAHLPKLFPELEDLDISDCPKLKRLPEEMNLRTLTIYGKTKINETYLRRFAGLHPDFGSLVFKTDSQDMVNIFKDFAAANNYKTKIDFDFTA